MTLAAPPSRTVPSPSWPSHSLALGNLPARFCISAQDTSLHLCSARRNIVSVRVMNGFTCLIDFDRKKFDVKVVVGRVVERRGPVLPSHVCNIGGISTLLVAADLVLAISCHHQHQSSPLCSHCCRAAPASNKWMLSAHAQLLSVGLRDGPSIVKQHGSRWQLLSLVCSLQHMKHV